MRINRKTATPATYIAARRIKNGEPCIFSSHPRATRGAKMGDEPQGEWQIWHQPAYDVPGNWMNVDLPGLYSYLDVSPAYCGRLAAGLKAAGCTIIDAAGAIAVTGYTPRNS